MKERSITADVFYVLTIMGTAWFMFWAFPGLWVWTTLAICQWMLRLFPHFKELMVFCPILACLFPIPCCLAGYFLMRRNKEEIRYPGAAFIFWLNLAIILFFGSFLLWGALTDKLPF